MDIAILIANLFSTAACIVMVVLGFVRKKENLVKGQAIQLGLLAVSNTLLQAFSGTIGKQPISNTTARSIAKLFLNLCIVDSSIVCK